MKILFVNPSLRLGTDMLFLPVGLGYVMTYVKQEGYSFDLLDIDGGQLQDDYIESTKSSRQPSKDSWLDCPGGKRDLGESSDDAAFREFLEETGIRIDLNDERFTQVFAGCPDNRVPKYYGQKTNKLYVIEAVESTCNEKSEEIQLQFSNVKL